MKTLITIALLLNVNFLFCQLTTEYPFKTYVDASGNVYVTGYKNVGGDNEILIQKYNSSLSLIREAHYSNTGSDRGLDIISANGGLIYVCGYLYSSTHTSNDVVLLQYDPTNDNFDWVQTFGSSGDDKGYSLSFDGSYLYLCGYTTGANGKDFEVLKYNTSGTKLWASSYNAGGNSGDDIGTSILTDAGYVYVAGYEYNGSTRQNNMILTTFDKSDGSFEQKVVVANGSEDTDPTGFILCSVSSNNHIKSRAALTGYTQFVTNSGLISAIERNYITAYIEVDANNDHTISWVDTFATAALDVATGITSNTSGDIIVTGYSQNGTYGYDFVTLKYDKDDGSQDWSEYYDNSNGDDKASAITIDNNGYIAVSGFSENSSNSYTVTRYSDRSSYLDVDWTHTFQPSFFSLSQPASSYNYSTFLKHDTLNNLYLIAFNWDSSNHSGFSMIKYDTSGSVLYSMIDTSNSKPSHSGSNNTDNVLLNQNTPNPFNPSTIISYHIPEKSFISLKVYDLTGREVKTLIHSVQERGNHSVRFNADNLSSGVYFYVLNYSLNNISYQKMDKMVLIK